MTTSFDLTATTRDWALWLTRVPSVSETAAEAAFAPALLARLRTTIAFADAETWLIPASNDRHGRACVALLVRGSGAETVLLTGHFDTVPIDDYGDLAPLAIKPEHLVSALLRRLASPRTPAEARAKADLESGAFLPGRGLLDMKGGLAAGFAVAEAFARDPDRRGNLLFVAVPDEEVNSVGARALAMALPDIARDKGLDLVAAINLDAIADDGDGGVGRSIAFGSVGKLLLTATVVGVPTHASYPFAGLNAGAMASALAEAFEWAPELTDRIDGETPVAPTLLSLKDGKTHYNVTTPDTAFASWNVIRATRSADDVLAAAHVLAATAMKGLTTRLATRAVLLDVDTPRRDVAIITSADLFGAVRASPAHSADLDALERDLVARGLSLPDLSRDLTLRAWTLSGRTAPAIILGFGSLPYLPVALGASPRADRLRAAVDAARAAELTLSGTRIATMRYFPGISDMSFLGETTVADVDAIAANSPMWRHGIAWSGAVANLPTINLGPWGRDYHTPLERIHVGYGFEVLPRVVWGVVKGLAR